MSEYSCTPEEVNRVAAVPRDATTRGHGAAAGHAQAACDEARWPSACPLSLLLISSPICLPRSKSVHSTTTSAITFHTGSVSMDACWLLLACPTAPATRGPTTMPSSAMLLCTAQYCPTLHAGAPSVRLHHLGCLTSLVCGGRHAPTHERCQAAKVAEAHRGGARVQGGARTRRGPSAVGGR